MDRFELTRREFIRIGAGGVLAAGAIGIPSVFADTSPERMERNFAGVPVRPLGSTGEKVSILCLGGHHAGRVPDEGEAVALVRHAIDNGVTFLDNAWEYHGGRSERIAGKALKDGYRERAFVMTKIHGRSAEQARKQLDESLSRLGVDHVDLLQAHEVIYDDDPALVFAPDGMIEVLEEAKKSGKTRFVGFTGHKDPEIHLAMLKNGYPWDAVQMPVNAFDPHYRSFVRNVLPVLKERKIGVLAMKTMGDPYLLESGALQPGEALRFAWSQPVGTVVSGMESMALLNENIGHAKNFTPMSRREQEELLARTASAASGGEWEKYKTSLRFDGPVGRKIHGVPVETG